MFTINFGFALFKTPAPADRTANSIAAVAIAIALILALAVPGLRRNTHYTGTLALTWSLVCALVAGVLTPTWFNGAKLMKKSGSRVAVKLAAQFRNGSVFGSVFFLLPFSSLYL